MNPPAPSKPDGSANNAPGLRVILLWCLPALIVGLVLRVRLCHHEPFAFFNSDAFDFLHTSVSLHDGHGFAVHWKKTFLVPVVYWLFTLTGAPIAIAIPLLQHLLGILLIVFSGVLGARIFRHWKIFVPLVTLLFAINPSLLYYEHSLMAETIFVFCIFIMALAAMRYIRTRSISALATMSLAVFFAAGVRPEGKYFVLFPVLLLVLTEFRKPLRLVIGCITMFIALGLATLLNPRGNEAGAMLVTSLIHLVPDDLKSAPDFAPRVLPLRDQAALDWQKFDRNRLRISPNWHANLRKLVLNAAVGYLRIGALPDNEKFARVNQLLLKVGREICLRRPLPVLGVTAKKAMCTINEIPAPSTDAGTLHSKHEIVLINGAPAPEYAHLLFGRDLQTPEETRAFIESHYRPSVPWFNTLRVRWLMALRKGALPRKTWDFAGIVWPGIPPVYVIAIAGLFLSILRKNELRPLFISLGFTLALVAAMLFLSGNVRVRYRFFLEPFWILYAAILCDIVAVKITAATLGLKRRAAP